MGVELQRRHSGNAIARPKIVLGGMGMEDHSAQLVKKSPMYIIDMYVNFLDVDGDGS
jgi:hypothetical protein